MGRPARADRAAVDAIEEHRFAPRSLEDLRCGSTRATSLLPPASAATATPAFRAPPTGSTPGKRRDVAESQMRRFYVEPFTDAEQEQWRTVGLDAAPDAGGLRADYWPKTGDPSLALRTGG